jgi:long-chain-fatty-acid--[acyl-carrier-protein] ligase
MFKKAIALVILYFIRFSLWFRYKVTIRGLENLNPSVLNKPGGVLFLPNHPTFFVDPSLITIAAWKKYPVRPMAVEYMFYHPAVHPIMRIMNALPIPNFVTSSNSLKKRKAEQVFDAVIEGVKHKENFLIYPAGKTKHQAKEIISASGVHKIIEAAPEANIVLVRITGLWGSRFSRALCGTPPAMFEIIWWGIKVCLKNLLFFTPRRHVTIEFVPAPPDFPYHSTRMEMNRYLEKWYNRPDGINPQEGDEPGESLNLVSYSTWREELPEITLSLQEEGEINIANIPDDIKTKVKKKLTQMTQLSPDKLTPEMNLATDLGMDSLDNAELIAFLDDEFEVSGVPVNELTTVGKLMGLAAHTIPYGKVKEEEQHLNFAKWNKPHPHVQADISDGTTTFEAFLNSCQQRKGAAACGDAMAGILTYNDLKMRALLLAGYIKDLPGQYIGIMLPSSVAAYVTVFACQLAGKIPLMVNWTVGPRHLESVLTVSNVEVILSSWAFIDRLENVDLTPIEEKILMLEDVRRKLSIKDKIKALYLSKLSTKTLLNKLNLIHITKEDTAVLLFTSGTENMPKGVPLTHNNLLSNQRGAIQEVKIYQDDILLGMLPPFHSFGFTVTGLLPLLAGIRVAYSPDPTDGKHLAHVIEKWKTTIVCGAPSFLKGIFKNSTPHQLDSIRICFTGAEKAPEDLFKIAAQLSRCRLLEGYGITECSPILTANLSGDPSQGVGKPFAGTELCIVSLETHEPLPQGERGLVLARGPNVFKGYLNVGVSSPFITVNGQQWYSTGDLGYLTPEGSLILAGRLKRFIKIGGEMVSLVAIEDALHPILPEYQKDQEGPRLAVCAREEAGEKTKIFVFTLFSISLEEINRTLREAGFSNLVKVSKIRQLSEIPLMGSGKINYRALETQLSEMDME